MMVNSVSTNKSNDPFTAPSVEFSTGTTPFALASLHLTKDVGNV